MRALKLTDLRLSDSGLGWGSPVAAPRWAYEWREYKPGTGRGYFEPVELAWRDVLQALQLRIDRRAEREAERGARRERLRAGTATELDRLAEAFDAGNGGCSGVEGVRLRWYLTRRHLRACRGCGAEFWALKQGHYCTDACHTRAAGRQTAEANRRAIGRRSATRAEARAGRACAAWGERFTPRRSTARFCSPACRVRVHRQKVG